MRAKLSSHYLLFLVLLIAICYSCERSPSLPETGIDPSVTGVWAKRTSSDSKGLPAYTINGLEISDDGSLTPLAVKTSSGQLKNYDHRVQSNTRVIFARAGRFRMEVTGVGLALCGEFDGNYEVSSEQIRFYRPDGAYLPYLNGTYRRSQLGETVAEPIISEFFVMMDTVSFVNARIWPSPSAYASYSTTADGAELRIRANSINDDWVEILVRGFAGVGDYAIGTPDANWASYQVISGDVIFATITTQPDAGILKMDSFDLQSNSCSGTFSFQIDQVHFTNGSFAIPIYR